MMKVRLSVHVINKAYVLISTLCSRVTDQVIYILLLEEKLDKKGKDKSLYVIQIRKHQ